MTDTTAIAFSVAPEVAIKNAADFTLYAAVLGVEVKEKGRKPFGALLKAIDADERFTLVDTPYFNRDSATTTSKPGSNGYGERLAVLRADREQAIKDAHAAFETARAALRKELGMSEDTPVANATGNAYQVTANIPQREKDTGKIKRNKAGDKVLFLPGQSKVTVTNAEVRELADTGSRGRLSTSAAVVAAVLKGEWLPKELLTEDGWESVLLKNVKVEKVTVDATDTVAAA